MPPLAPPERAEMAARAKLEYTRHVCPVHRVHALDDLETMVLAADREITQ
jgi:hypothetical protein